MTDRIRSTNVRFNLDKEIPAQAWQYLQTMDRQEFKSYSQVIAAALVDYFDRYYKSREDPYLEEQFVQQIVSAVEKSMEKALPAFLAGCMAGLSKSNAAVPPAESPSTKNISQFSGLLSEQSASLPGSPEPERTVFRCTNSRARRAA